MEQRQWAAAAVFHHTAAAKNGGIVGGAAAAQQAIAGGGGGGGLPPRSVRRSHHRISSTGGAVAGAGQDRISGTGRAGQGRSEGLRQWALVFCREGARRGMELPVAAAEPATAGVVASMLAGARYFCLCSLRVRWWRQRV